MTEANSFHREQIHQLHFRLRLFQALPNFGWSFFKRKVASSTRRRSFVQPAKVWLTSIQRKSRKMQTEAMYYKIRLHRAESTVSDVVAHAERELANRAKANHSTVDSMTGELNQLK